MISSAPVNTEPAATTTSTGRQLDGKTALVTGGNSGIGLATAQRLAAEGAHVFLTGRNQDTIDAAVATIGDGATGIRADVSSIDDLTKVAEAIAARGHGLDILFANAGGGEFTALGRSPPSSSAAYSSHTSAAPCSPCKPCWRCSTPARRSC